ncbi:acyl carrier protein [Gloeothece verrucosa]|uniref:Phosphopantetheine-binding protein n=1 Tax=Gloeothece verrucosa (strain PCC 7822) TaxID=497965 RepID=E0UL83_GLOV7|nr:acyl carrier protein [Gloeothece verrucosa]ADN17713.1 phosphopantetheine-binding protein [Gloeothece verrucosa PCC 7822]
MTNTFQLQKTTKSYSDIQKWMINYIADLLEVDPDEIDPSTPFDGFGLDSSAAIGMTGDLELWLGREIEPTVLYDYPNIERLSQYLTQNPENN